MKKFDNSHNQLGFEFETPLVVSNQTCKVESKSNIVKVTFGQRKTTALTKEHDPEEKNLIEQILSSARKLSW